MRVLAGTLKGFPLKSPKKKLRPTCGKVKESVFNICQNMEGKKFLDLFCGFGSMGIEALSRGSCKASFVEKDRKIFSFLKKNIRELHLENKADIYCMDVFNFLKKERGSFDIIYIDPPYALYKGDFLKEVFFLLWKNNFAKDSLIFVEGPDKKIKILDINFCFIKIKRYGDSFLAIYENKILQK